MARSKSVTKTDMERLFSTAKAAGLIVSKVIMKAGSIEVVFGDVDQIAESDDDEVKPREW